MSQEIRKQIVIIGAGAAGVAAATRLHENGIKDMIVIEAENRIGGRVHTLFQPDKNVLEIGAQWIHGKKRNCVYELAEAHKKCVSSNIGFNNMIMARTSGELITQDLSETMHKAFRGIHKDFMITELRLFQSSGQFFTKKFEEEFSKKEYARIPKAVKEEFIEYCHQFLNSYNASDSWFDTSISGLTEYKECSGNNFLMWRESGFITLFDILIEKCGKDFLKNYFLFNTEIVRVTKNENRLRVKCSDGKIFIADHVICTISIGVLAEFHEQMFEKLLIPQEKIRAIRGLTLGTVDKMYLHFSEVWWPLDANGFGFLWTEDDRQEFKEKGIEWATGIFAICRVDFAPHVLCGWISGAAARAMEQIELTKVQETITYVIRKCLGNKWNIPEADQLIRSEWYSNKHFRGAYSFRSLRADDEGVWSSQIACPVTNEKGIPILLFAGEATHTHYYSTVHGAVESGWREANRIISLKKKDVKL